MPDGMFVVNLLTLGINIKIRALFTNIRHKKKLNHVLNHTLKITNINKLKMAISGYIYIVVSFTHISL